MQIKILKALVWCFNQVTLAKQTMYDACGRSHDSIVRGQDYFVRLTYTNYVYPLYQLPHIVLKKTHLITLSA